MKSKSRLALFAVITLTACDGEKSADELAKARRKSAAAADPAVTAALADPIMSDPDLSVADDSRRVRHVSGPAEVTYPPRSKANARALAGLDGLAAPTCGTGFTSGKAWIAKLPPAFAPYPGAGGIEASGMDKPGCRVRVASFATTATPWRILNHYRVRVTGAGYTAATSRRGADHVLTGSRLRDGASFYLIVTPGANANAVALLASGG